MKGQRATLYIIGISQTGIHDYFARTEQRLYWTDGWYDTIQSVDLDDLSDRRTHISFEQSDVVVFGISAYYDQIYITDSVRGGFFEYTLGTRQFRAIRFHETPVDVHVYASK